MGGKAFAAPNGNRPALVVPRLSPQQYSSVRDDVLNRLRSLFSMVSCPREAPGKSDHGDIDIVVADPKEDVFWSVCNSMSPEARQSLSQSTGGDEQMAALVHHLSAKYFMKNGKTYHFALRHPIIHGGFVQLDVNEQPLELHAWTAFHASYGDFWNIIGTSIRPYGLCITEDGMYVIDSEMETFNKKRARTFLTREPRQVMSFLGLNLTEWEQGWRDEIGMFRFAAGNRFFNPVSYVFKKFLKANDRKRILKRPCFARFVNEYAPSVLKPKDSEEGFETTDRWGQIVPGPNGKLLVDAVNRAKVLDEALESFDVREIYETSRRLWKDEQMELEKKRILKAQRRLDYEKLNKDYGQHWIEWFLNSLTDSQRHALDLDMDKRGL